MMENELINPREFLKRMEALAHEDTEGRHYEADKLMTEILEQLGYVDGVKLFWSWTKWWA